MNLLSQSNKQMARNIYHYGNRVGHSQGHQLSVLSKFRNRYLQLSTYSKSRVVMLDRRAGAGSCHTLTIVCFVFLCFVWSGCDLSGHSMLDVQFVCFCVWPDMVLNQMQVLVVVSNWQPYLGSLFCHCGLWVIVYVRCLCQHSSHYSYTVVIRLLFCIVCIQCSVLSLIKKPS